MANEPFFSIITICKNEEHRIADTAESISRQTFQNFEWIVIDGLSTDKTIERLTPYRARITHFRSEKDTGIYNAQNKGLNLATGRYVLFLNGGDQLWSVDVLDRVQAFATLNADILYGDLMVDDGDQAKLKTATHPITIFQLLHSTVWHPASFIKRQLLVDMGGFDESFRITGDYDFFLRAFVNEKARFHYLGFPVARFFTDGIGSSKDFSVLHREERRRAQLRYFPWWLVRSFQAYRLLTGQSREPNSATQLASAVLRHPYLKECLKKAALRISGQKNT